MKIDLTPPSSSDNPWDRPVPLMTHKNNTDVYITETIEEPSLYNEFCALLRDASEAETVNLYLNTPGGMIDSAFMIIDAIKNSKAKVIAHLSGTVASAGTIIALSCNDLVVANHTAFMIHNYSGGLQGKGHEMKAHQRFIDESLNKAFEDIYKGFLTPEEMIEVIDGKDMWMGKEEVLARFDGSYHKKTTSKKG